MDVQISLDGATQEVNDAVRGAGSYAMALRAMENLAAAGFPNFKISVVMTRHNVPQLDDFAALADRFGAQLRITRLRPSGRGADVWADLHPTDSQQREIYSWLTEHGDADHLARLQRATRPRGQRWCSAHGGVGRVPVQQYAELRRRRSPFPR